LQDTISFFCKFKLKNMKISFFFTGTILLLLQSITVKSQTVDEIIQKHISSRGGIGKIKSVNTVVMEGFMNIAGVDAAITVSFSHLKGSRTEYSANGQTGFSIYTDQEGWNYNPFGSNPSVVSIGKEQVMQSQHQLDLHGTLIDYKEKGIAILLKGKMTIEGKECNVLELSWGDMVRQNLFLDSSGLIVKSINFKKAGDNITTTETLFYDYRKNEDGYLFSFTRMTANGEISFSSIKVNRTLPENIFKPE